MRKSIETVINEMKSKMSGYVVLLHYRFSNLCVKAEPAALLSMTIMDLEDEQHNFEDVACAMIKDPCKMEIIPKDPKMLYNVCKGVLEAHPEFKQEIVTASDENRMDPDNKDEQHIICTMPEVNQDRHDLLMDNVAVLYDGCKSKINSCHDAYKVKMTSRLVGSTEDDIHEAENSMEEIFNKHIDMINDFRTKKEQEIEDAYHAYLDRQDADKAKQQEIADARGVGKGFTYDMNDEDNK